ncbi:MAG: thioesterase domain-containing protein, partial [Nitrososphaera sp.]
LGGHSLLAIRLMAQLEKEFQVAVPLATLFQAPTVEQLAGILRQQGQSLRWSPVVAIQPKGTLPRFFCVAGGVGSVLYYYPLAHRLGPEQPFYGLQAKGLNGDCKPYERVEDMASHYLEAIRAVQPEGPYWLGGHCVGGIVAFEFAQQLARQGQAIALLSVLDIPAPCQEARAVSDELDDATWVLRLGRLLEQGSGKDLGLSCDDLLLLNFEEQSHYLKERMINAQMLPAGAGIAQVRGLVQVFKASSLAQYVPAEHIHPMPIALFRASEYHDDYDFSAADRHRGDIQVSTLRWCQFSQGPVEVYVVPGNHVTMMWEPHVSVLAKRLGIALTKTSSRNNTFMNSHSCG